MKKCYLSIIILFSLNVQAEHVFKANPKSYQGSLIVDPLFTESDFVFKEYNPLPWIELERSTSNFTPLISNQTTNFIQNGIDTILQERTIQHIYTNTKINQDVVKEISKEEQTITEPSTRNIIVQKTNTLETENKSNCTEWTPLADTKYTDEIVEQTQECDVQIIDTYSYFADGNVLENKDINGTIKKTFEQEINGTKPLVFNSCKEILDAGRSTGNGDYTLNVNGSAKNVYCDMSDGGWTLYDEFDANYFSKKPYNSTIETIEDLQTSGYFFDLTHFYNDYLGWEDTVVLRNGYKMFFYSDVKRGSISFNLNKNIEVKIIYGNPYIDDYCNIFVNGQLKQSTAPKSNNIFVSQLKNTDTIKIEEGGICSIDSIWIK